MFAGGGAQVLTFSQPVYNLQLYATGRVSCSGEYGYIVSETVTGRTDTTAWNVELPRFRGHLS